MHPEDFELFTFENREQGKMRVCALSGHSGLNALLRPKFAVLLVCDFEHLEFNRIRIGWGTRETLNACMVGAGATKISFFDHCPATARTFERLCLSIVATITLTRIIT